MSGHNLSKVQGPGHCRDSLRRYRAAIEDRLHRLDPLTWFIGPQERRHGPALQEAHLSREHLHPEQVPLPSHQDEHQRLQMVKSPQTGQRLQEPSGYRGSLEEEIPTKD